MLLCLPMCALTSSAPDEQTGLNTVTSPSGLNSGNISVPLLADDRLKIVNHSLGSGMPTFTAPVQFR